MRRAEPRVSPFFLFLFLFPTRRTSRNGCTVPRVSARSKGAVGSKTEKGAKVFSSAVEKRCVEESQEKSSRNASSTDRPIPVHDRSRRAYNNLLALVTSARERGGREERIDSIERDPRAFLVASGSRNARVRIMRKALRIGSNRYLVLGH